MEIHQLTYAVAIADHGSFTRAAESLHVRQSGVSAQVARLERELGVTLFDRGARAVQLTNDGAVIVDRMRAVLAALDEVRSAASEVTGLLRGSVRVGAVAGLSWPPFIDAIAGVRREHPQLDVSLREGISRELQAAVRSGELDVAVVSWSQRPLDGLESWVALTEQVSVVVSAEHPWAARRQVAPSELLGQPVICMTEGTGMRSAYDNLLRAEGLAAPVQWEVTLPTTVRMMAARGLGVGIVTASEADPPSDLVRVSIDSPHSASYLGVTWRAKPPPSAACRAMLDAFQKHLLPED